MIKKWENQTNISKHYSFATSDVVIKYVKNENPSSLIITTLGDDERVNCYMKNKEVICLKMKRDENNASVIC